MNRPLEPGEGISLDVVAELFQTAYDMGQQAPRPGDMVVAHFQENARSVSDGAIYAATSKLYSEYDRKLQHDIAQLQNEHLPYCKHCKQRHAYSDPCELLEALRQATAYAQEEARRALDTAQPLVIEEPKSDIAMLLDPNTCRHLNMQHDVSGSTCLDCGAQMTTIVRIDQGHEPERDDPHEDLGYRGRK